MSQFFHEKPGEVTLEALLWLSPGILEVLCGQSPGGECLPLTHTRLYLQIKVSEETSCLPSCKTVYAVIGSVTMEMEI